LGSGSARRQEMMKKAGFAFEVASPEVEEMPPGTLPLRRLCEANAELKAQVVLDDYPHAVVLAADTLVAIGSEALGKPRDLSEARETLARLSGRVHEVCTGVCIRTAEEEATFFEVTWVKFHHLKPATIEDYLAKVEVLDKAGSYAIQECGEMLVEKLEGDYDNVVGLPIERVVRELERFGLRPG
jgi:septum formation protein